MRTLIGLAALASLSVVGSALAAPSADETAIMKIENEMAAASTAAQVTHDWSQDAVFEDMMPGEVVGKAAIVPDLDKQFAALANPKAEILRIKVVADGKVGFAYSTQHFTSGPKDGKPGMDVVFRETDGFEKKGGKWQLVHQHISVPFDPATGKAVFDSK